MMAVAEGGGDIVLHVHDEIGIESLSEDPVITEEVFESLICSPTDWGTGFPVAATVKRLARYAK